MPITDLISVSHQPL